jgi:hypothetical protein
VFLVLKGLRLLMRTENGDPGPGAAGKVAVDEVTQRRFKQ